VGNSGNGAEQDKAPHLTPRERDVLRLIAEGLRSQEIAERLQIPIGEVEVHWRMLRSKLGLHTIAELTRYAVREGIVKP
jgi:two-component system NarL family response regulator